MPGLGGTSAGFRADRGRRAWTAGDIYDLACGMSKECSSHAPALTLDPLPPVRGRYGGRRTEARCRREAATSVSWPRVAGVSLTNRRVAAAHRSVSWVTCSGYRSRAHARTRLRASLRDTAARRCRALRDRVVEEPGLARRTRGDHPGGSARTRRGRRLAPRRCTAASPPFPSRATRSRRATVRLVHRRHRSRFNGVRTFTGCPCASFTCGSHRRGSRSSTGRTRSRHGCGELDEVLEAFLRERRADVHHARRSARGSGTRYATAGKRADLARSMPASSSRRSAKGSVSTPRHSSPFSVGHSAIPATSSCRCVEGVRTHGEGNPFARESSITRGSCVCSQCVWITSGETVDRAWISSRVVHNSNGSCPRTGSRPASSRRFEAKSSCTASISAADVRLRQLRILDEDVQHPRLAHLRPLLRCPEPLSAQTHVFRKNATSAAYQWVRFSRASALNVASNCRGFDAPARDRRGALPPVVAPRRAAVLSNREPASTEDQARLCCGGARESPRS